MVSDYDVFGYGAFGYEVYRHYATFFQENFHQKVRLIFFYIFSNEDESSDFSIFQYFGTETEKQ